MITSSIFWNINYRCLLGWYGLGLRTSVVFSTGHAPVFQNIRALSDILNDKLVRILVVIIFLRSAFSQESGATCILVIRH